MLIEGMRPKNLEKKFIFYTRINYLLIVKKVKNGIL